MASRIHMHVVLFSQYCTFTMVSTHSKCISSITFTIIATNSVLTNMLTSSIRLHTLIDILSKRYIIFTTYSCNMKEAYQHIRLDHYGVIGIHYDMYKQNFLQYFYNLDYILLSLVSTHQYLHITEDNSS